MRKESEDYRLVGAVDDTDQWDIEILTGEFAHTIIRYGAIEMPENDNTINFNFEIVHKLNEELTEENEDLQVEVGEILQSVLHMAIERFTEETEIIEEE